MSTTLDVPGLGNGFGASLKGSNMNSDWDGFITGVSDGDYHRMPGVSPTRARHMLTSPLAYKAAGEAAYKVTDEMLLGTAIHAAVLNQWTAVVKWDGDRRGTAWKTFEAEHAEDIILTAPYYERWHNAFEAVIHHDICNEIDAFHAQNEVGMKWTHDNGIRCRGKMDHVGERIIDLKTTTDIDDRAIIRAVTDLAYHMQLAAYRDGYRRLTGRELATALVFVQTRPPFDCRVIRVEGPELERGYELWCECLNKIKACEETGEWPGIAPEETALVLPEWALGHEYPDLVE